MGDLVIERKVKGSHTPRIGIIVEWHPLSGEEFKKDFQCWEQGLVYWFGDHQHSIVYEVDIEPLSQKKLKKLLDKS